MSPFVCAPQHNTTQQARRRAAREEEREEAAHRDGAQFGCSQTAVTAGDQQWANSLDVTIEAFSISAHDKTLFKDSPLQVRADGCLFYWLRSSSGY